MIAICPAGPPKLMKPSLNQKRRASMNAGAGAGGAVVGFSACDMRAFLAVVAVKAVENAARVGQEFVVVGRTRAQSRQHGLDARRLGHRHTADIEAVNDGSDARQRRIAFQAEAGRQHFEAHAAADMG
jgi:hypothetical protein